MEVVTTIADARRLLDQARTAERTVGLVPTMGSLHAGHLSLIRRSVAECPTTAVTVFVNPLQFAPTEDFSAYPRQLERDCAMAEAEGADIVFAPPTEAMYPGPVLTSVKIADLSERLDGASRPGHFDGVATVVTKLFSIAGPCRAYFGEKDYQQLLIVRRLAFDLSIPVEVVGCPIVREPDGLARSSRNAYLTPEQRAEAPVLHRALRAGVGHIEDDGERDPAVIRALMAKMIEATVGELDYAEVVDAATLHAVDPIAGAVRLLVAARFGRARLIDNMGADGGRA